MKALKRFLDWSMRVGAYDAMLRGLAMFLLFVNTKSAAINAFGLTEAKAHQVAYVPLTLVLAIYFWIK